MRSRNEITYYPLYAVGVGVGTSLIWVVRQILPFG